MKKDLNKEDLEKMILEEYRSGNDLVCGCEDIPYEQYRLFRLKELSIEEKSE